MWQNLAEIFLNQGKYVVEILKRFKMLDCKAIATPMAPNLKLICDPTSEIVDVTVYMKEYWFVDVLDKHKFKYFICDEYLDLVHGRADICVHIVVEKHVVMYLKYSIKHVLKCARDQRIFLQGYVDSNWPGNATNRKSTSRCCFSLGFGMISWCSKKKTSVALSTFEA